MLVYLFVAFVRQARPQNYAGQLYHSICDEKKKWDQIYEKDIDKKKNS